MTDNEAANGLEAIRYRIVRPYAQGGLGEVFIAEDTQLQRQVALKEIRKEYRGNPIRRERFLIEAKITGRLEHPGVVPVYGMGTHADGRVFYAMRFIKGETLKQAVRRFHAGPAPDHSGLEFRLLLNRFVDVCNTVAYAHEQGILHRDLKPSNIMLGDFGETLVVDWGIAKHIGIPETTESQSSSDDQTSSLSGSITIQGQAIGSPAYMSPEQAAGNLELLGRGSDIYCLGATLYDMLTDRTPFSGKDDEVLLMVRQGQFPRPRRLNPRVPVALEAICCKAMALKPEARHQSALDVAKDIECWLADRPVSAYREPWTDKTRRWMRQNQTAVSGLAAAVTALFLAFGTALPLLSYAWRNEAMARQEEHSARAIAVKNLVKAEEQRALAIANEKAADERDRAENALKFLVQAFRKPDPAADGRALKVADLLNRAAQEVDVTLADSPPMRAMLLQAIGETFAGLGLLQESLSAFQRVTELRRQTLRADHSETLASMSHLAAALQDAGRVDEAISLFEATLSKRTAVLGESHPSTVETINDLAVAYQEAGQYKRAIPLYQRVLEQMRVTLGEDHLDTLTVTDNLAVAFAAVGEPDRAIPLHEMVLTRLRTKLGNEHPTTLVTMNNLAKAYEIKGRHGDAMLLFKKALGLIAPKLGLDHPYRLSLLHGLAMAHLAAGQKAEAMGIYEETLARRRSKLGDVHPDTIKTALSLARVYFLVNLPQKAVPLAEEFLVRADGISDHLPERSRNDLREVAHHLVDHFTSIGQEAQAKAYRRLLEPSHRHD